MAEKKMVDDLRQPFFDAVCRVVRELDRRHGPLYLAMIVQFKDRPSDDWILLLASHSLAGRRAQSIREVTETLGAKLEREHARRIRRIGILEKTDPVFKSITRAFKVRLGATADIKDCSFDGMDVARAVLFVSRTDPGRSRGKSRKPGRSRQR